MRDKITESRLTRRSILRRGAVVGTATVVGIPALSGTVFATDCPKSPGYWANHDWCSYPGISNSTTLQAHGLDCSDATSEMELRETGVSMTLEEWQEFLLAPTRGDATTKMAQTLLTTVLNFQITNNCVDTYVDLSSYGVTETTIRDVKRKAEEWLESSPFDGNTDVKYGWDAGGFDGEPYKDVLDAYNNNEFDIGCPSCRDEEDEKDEKDEKGEHEWKDEKDEKGEHEWKD